MIHYELIFEYKSNDDPGLYGTYGLAAYRDGKHIETISDISCDKEKIKKLAVSFNENALEPEHLSQAIEEFLYDFEV